MGRKHVHTASIKRHDFTGKGSSIEHTPIDTVLPLACVFSKTAIFYENSTQDSYYINFKLTMRIRDITICTAMQL